MTISRLSSLKLLTALTFTSWGLTIIISLATPAAGSTGSSTVPVPPFLRYLTESDLNAARQLAKDRHEQAVKDALTNFPIDDIPCSPEDDQATVANTPVKEHPVTLSSKLPDFHDELPSSIFESLKPLLTREECAHVIQMADEHFGGNEWTALPAGEYKMRGFKLKDVPAIREFIVEVFRKRFIPIVQHTNPKFAASIADLALDNCYLMKFTPATGARMDIHCDDGCLSFTIQMNPREEYVGGGTWFEGLADARGDTDNHAAGIVKMDVGHVHFRAGAIRHCGFTITEGKRYVIGGFGIHRSKTEHVRLLMRGNTDDEMQLSLPAVVALNPEYDEGYAMLAHDWDVRQGRADDAKEVLEYCLEHVNPKCSKVAFSLGVRHYRREGKHDKVMDCMKIVLQYDPYDVLAMAAMADAASEVGDVAVEKEMYERIVQVAGVSPERKANAYRDLGLLHKGRDLQVEIDCYQKAVEAHDNYHARYSLGRALFQAGELEKARESFLAAYSQDDTSVGALKAIYRTAKTILEKDASLSDSDDLAKAQRMIELVGGEENHSKIQSMMANPFGTLPLPQ
ncbi:P4Hc [Seminavis robusta]|uniref:P4Hc n=1 Tax=Seminavis robusta TaxID=568900 RepID=A0A9N8DWQ4_9STRA|nr:P4Hc [Seminavis robusta]|eukprot:Sro409_g137170.1 P4Hc (569) ;mRNA; r:26447-28153